ncbi:glycoside hydrolase superfamily [Massariosphaeria phaeospora]|uniref:Glycoside hydrolase superfamily n=1 Tax=Massariosphaeria phaeospora TaxID=100035 RepID=A0A7C8M5F3_9PLEO|nr:glycoside hydrolase superfamily [Massariosphaeria phaeospora]
MKLTPLACALVAGVMFVGVAVGYPFDIKRDLVTEVVWTTVTLGNVIVYVDEQGVPYATTTTTEATGLATTVAETSSAILPSSTPAVPSSMLASQSNPATSALPSFMLVSEKDVVTSVVLEHKVPTPVESGAPAQPPAQSPAQPPAQPPAPSPTPETKEAGPLNFRVPLGVTYDPFMEGGCKPATQLSNEFDAMYRDYGIVRIYGNDCGLIPLAVQKAAGQGKKLMAGVWLPNQRIEDVVNALREAVVKYAGGRWDVISLVSVENERVLEKTMAVSQAIDAVREARRQLRDAGYGGPVGAVEIPSVVVDNPALCEPEVVMVNVHPFFNRDQTAQNAGRTVREQVNTVVKACPNKPIVVTESGWPHEGQTNGAAVPSVENQKAAMASIGREFDGNLFFHNAFDSGWKKDWEGSFGAERYWGVIS